MPISYKPLRKTLIDRDLNITRLREKGVFGTSTSTSLNNDRPVSLAIIADICTYLNVPIEEVVEVLLPDKSDEQ
ncbi:helix-turn-helix domain-containing protein [Oceanobacillus sojae]|uniref:helix-turn-helix domain-containing protein n=1 Tax=Oceanobacillus sojae TaxID=582851 RepID=UPI003632E428